MSRLSDDEKRVFTDRIAELMGKPCSVCGQQPTLLVDASEKGTYWKCAECMFETIQDKMKLEEENTLLAEHNQALLTKTEHTIQSVNIIRGTMRKDHTHKDLFGGTVYLVDHTHMWALVRNVEELDALLTGGDDVAG